MKRFQTFRTICIYNTVKIEEIFIYSSLCIMSMSLYLEFFVVIFITYLFIKMEKPKIRYLFLGYAFFFLALILQFPLRVAEYYLKSNYDFAFLSIVSIPILSIIVSELTKYFSLKTFLKTKSHRNGILFGIAWVSLESISFVSAFFYLWLFQILNISFMPMLFSGTQFAFINFIFFFVVNLGVTVLIIMAIIKRRTFYLIHGILLSILVYLGLSLLVGVESFVFSLLSFMYCSYLIFKYRWFK